MTSRHLFTSARGSLALALVAIGGIMSGCQTDIGGQTLPSAWYLRDDVQFFPAGPEFLLPNQVQALDEYRSSREGLEVVPPPAYGAPTQLSP